MRYWAISLLVLAALIIQTTILVYFEIGGVTPNLLMILTYSLGFLFGPAVGVGIGLVSGLFQDLLLGRYIGLNALALGLVGLLSGQAEDRVWKDNPLVPVLGGVAGTLLSELVVLTVLWVMGVRISVLHSFRETILPLTLYNTLLGCLVYLWLYRRYKFLRPYPRIMVKSKERNQGR